MSGRRSSTRATVGKERASWKQQGAGLWVGRRRGRRHENEGQEKRGRFLIRGEMGCGSGTDEKHDCPRIDPMCRACCTTVFIRLGARGPPSGSCVVEHAARVGLWIASRCWPITSAG